MKLQKDQLGLPEWQNAGYAMPKYDWETIKQNTIQNPVWLHFGAGNIFRMFPAMLQQKLLDQGKADKGVIVCECFDEEIITGTLQKYDDLSIAVTLKVDGTVEKAVIGSVVTYLCGSTQAQEVAAVFTNPGLQVVSFTITEKGYAIPSQHIEKSILYFVASLLLKRYECGGHPITLLSMDNCSHNGDKLREGVLAAAAYLVSQQKADEGFLSYIQNPQQVAFPYTMIDKITPGPSEKVLKMLQADGLEDCAITETAKHTVVSCFVNAEEAEYLVIEDIFANGRPAWEAAGVLFTDRPTVDKVEKMKVCTCLNPLHTALAAFGCLLRHPFVSDIMKDADIVHLIKQIGYTEGLPVVVDPQIINPRHFIDEVIQTRLPNIFVPDTPQRIIMDTSQKIPIRFGETIKAYQARGWDTKTLTYIPFFFAGWLRYLTGVDDFGEPLALSPDPLLEKLTDQLKGLTKDNVHEKVAALLSDAELFGADLYACGIGEKTEDFLRQMLEGTGAVRKALASLT